LKEGRIKKKEATKRLKEELRIRLRRGYGGTREGRAADGAMFDVRCLRFDVKASKTERGRKCGMRSGEEN
jgi:hypothetical protein